MAIAPDPVQVVLLPAVALDGAAPDNQVVRQCEHLVHHGRLVQLCPPLQLGKSVLQDQLHRQDSENDAHSKPTRVAHDKEEGEHVDERDSDQIENGADASLDLKQVCTDERNQFTAARLREALG